MCLPVNVKTRLCRLGEIEECSACHLVEDMKRNMFPALALTVAVLPLLVLALDGCQDLTVTPAAGTPSMAEMTSGSFLSTSASGHLAPEETSPSEPLSAGAASGPANTKKQTTTLYPVVTGLVVAPNLSMPSRYEDGDPHLVWDGTWDTGAGAPSQGLALPSKTRPELPSGWRIPEPPSAVSPGPTTPVGWLASDSTVGYRRRWISIALLKATR
jgi:hypothetical protein